MYSRTTPAHPLPPWPWLSRPPLKSLTMSNDERRAVPALNPPVKISITALSSGCRPCSTSEMIALTRAPVTWVPAHELKFSFWATASRIRSSTVPRSLLTTSDARIWMASWSAKTAGISAVSAASPASRAMIGFCVAASVIPKIFSYKALRPALSTGTREAKHWLLLWRLHSIGCWSRRWLR